jgi:tRNA-2-methylthio-N6-dimethylallyladenosine synthase
VAGCAAQRLGPWLQKRFPHVDLIVGAKSIEEYPSILEEALGKKFDALEETAAAFESGFMQESFPSPTGSPASAYLTIMRGCNYSCSYCIVPSVRGRERYRPVEAILEEARGKVAGGARELILLGQTVNSYLSTHRGRPVGFAELIGLIDKISGLERLRFMSPHPYHFNEETIEAMASCRTVCEFIHLPVQSGSDRILKSMRRSYSRNSYLDLARRIKRSIPQAVFSTDVIVGFPSETEDDFRQSLDLLEELRPSTAYCFKFSPRQSTEAAGWPDDVSQEAKEERLSRLNEVVERLTTEALAAQTGRTVEVLAEQPDFGRTRTGYKVRWQAAVTPGTLVNIRILSATRRTLLGELHEPKAR